jgi:hypothetical protein
MQIKYPNVIQIRVFESKSNIYQVKYRQYDA